LIKNAIIVGLGGAAVYFWLHKRVWEQIAAGRRGPWWELATTGTPLEKVGRVLSAVEGKAP